MTEERSGALNAYFAITVPLDNDAARTETVGRICGRLNNKHGVSKARLVE
jgi:hypothetical protein